MTGDQLMARLARMTPEERSLEVVLGGDEDWYYDVSDLRIEFCEAGRVIENKQPPNVIVIQPSR